MTYYLSAFTLCLIALNELENITMSGAKSDLMVSGIYTLEQQENRAKEGLKRKHLDILL